MSDSAAIVLKARDIARAFPGVQALAGVELTLRAGEVHALMGQNGAGKSTLIKVLTGVYAPDAGSIELLGQPVTPQSPIHAQELGISAVHQESHLLPNLSVAENICAGRYPRRPWTRGGGIDWRETERRAARVVGRSRHRARRDAARGRPARRPAAARHRGARRRHRCARADPRRADLEPRRRRSQGAVRAHPTLARQGRRHPVRHAFPRPGLRDLRSHDGAAQRQVRRRIRLRASSMRAAWWPRWSVAKWRRPSDPRRTASAAAGDHAARTRRHATCRAAASSSPWTSNCATAKCWASPAC